MQATQHRARSEEAKVQRRETILGAAKQHFSDVGFEEFSMAGVGKQCGVAKGTL